MKIKSISGNTSVSLKRTIDAGTEEQRKAVRGIIEEVKKNGNSAVSAFTRQFDGADVADFRVSEKEIKEAYTTLKKRDLEIIRAAILNIKEYHERQLTSSWFYHRKDGTMLGQKITPLDSAGVYVPGGTAAYPSSVLMNVIPALVAGVDRIVLASPPGKDGKLSAGVLALSLIHI